MSHSIHSSMEKSYRRVCLFGGILIPIHFPNYNSKQLKNLLIQSGHLCFQCLYRHMAKTLLVNFAIVLIYHEPLKFNRNIQLQNLRRDYNLQWYRRRKTGVEILLGRLLAKWCSVVCRRLYIDPRGDNDAALRPGRTDVHGGFYSE